MAFIFGGKRSARFKEFERLCARAYNVLRKHSNLLISLFSLMLQCGIPELETDSDLLYLRDNLLIGNSNEEASNFMINKIHEALHVKATQFNDAMHMYQRT
jgi:phosphatidylinositol kinase/protein kinase (PI-3  family)